MNIFFLHRNPNKCARYHCDKHVVKMILESAQLLYTCFMMCHETPQLISSAPLTKSGNNGYRACFHNHPCAIWLRKSKDNYIWLCKMTIALCKEYTYRYNKIHTTEKHIHWLYEQGDGLNIKSKGLIKLALAMPDQYKCKSTKKSYRKYYIGEKGDFAKWTRRNIPKWYKKF